MGNFHWLSKIDTSCNGSYIFILTPRRGEREYTVQTKHILIEKDLGMIALLPMTQERLKMAFDDILRLVSIITKSR